MTHGERKAMTTEQKIEWLAALSAGGFGFVTAILLALTGLPEVKPPDEK